MWGLTGGWEFSGLTTGTAWRRSFLEPTFTGGVCGMGSQPLRGGSSPKDRRRAGAR